MNSQQLEYVRQQLIVATADLSGATKGQLVAFAENAQFTATARSRGRKKVFDKDKQRMVNPDGPPMSGSQSRAKGSSIALVSPVEFGTASWRRAVLSLEEHQKAWLLWNYSENIRFEYQVAITQWAWAEFREQLGAKKVAGKTIERLRSLSGWRRRTSKRSWRVRMCISIRTWPPCVALSRITGVITTPITGLPCAPSLSGLMAIHSSVL